MKRLIEKNRTYRIPRHDGTTELLHVISVGDTLKVMDLTTKKTKTMNKEAFQKRLDAGEIYVSANAHLIEVLYDLLKN